MSLLNARVNAHDADRTRAPIIAKSWERPARVKAAKRRAQRSEARAALRRANAPVECH